jgi:2-methylcitrate dehydratase PrpD
LAVVQPIPRHRMSKQVFLEYTPVGRSMKVVAVDPETGLEATIIAPLGSPRGEMDRIAVRKLERLIERQKS